MSRRADRRFMGRALELARLNYGLTGDNPSVGCVLVDPLGRIVGEGVTGEGGRPHAEQIALDDAGDRAALATAYVTLEPCRERSTGEDACSKRLIDAGIGRVVCAIADKHPKGAGGFAALRAAGIPVFVGLKQDDADVLYEDFFNLHG
ncbi:bifunctional diaminohydroxyphosphoribosylaminopyrimidine deaminase/5-amino-6-(5-phosphoribosylamino)uracil reductase RibD [Ponticaulis sp.]|uniref:bifunctional diaminohydroxyphosphoribosylaminopyrimidine deaminase/5-amino-6-(5-phosphoribosylamino)uracil reductase RibD n=1 Tax=Ponticaulis sp. TaxID=2020902 RepID=UPI0025DDA298|nr:bifunctional diaminohydroxyphosphoribosylaminopyrimidine deaminase/5-amino-6-(5-phosphoribosylamino)uracil reductase RibD [Ponticaulis sp.]